MIRVNFNSQEKGSCITKVKKRVLLMLSLLLMVGLAKNGFSQMVSANPSSNLQTLVNNNPPGTTFLISPGVYRLQSIVPKDWDKFIGQPGAILNGSQVLTSFTKSGSTWVFSGFVPKNNVRDGWCDSTHPACTFPEDLFFDNVLHTRVATLSAVTAGTWYLDYSASKVYVGDDPAGHTVEISVLPYAIYGNATGVIIQGLTVEKYAVSAGQGAISASTSGGAPSMWWAVMQNEVRFNHGMGVRIGNGTYIYDNLLHDNGQLGLGGTGIDVTVQNNQIYNNNTDGFDYGWEAGGAKFTQSSQLKIQYNNVHDNNGPGLNFDIDDYYVLVDSNHTARNLEAGILYEISYYGTIVNNYLDNDGISPVGPDLWWGGAIILTDSQNVEVSGNTIVNSQNGIGGLLSARGNDWQTGAPYLVKNINVHDNSIQVSHTAAGICILANSFDTSVFTSWNNHFQSNQFTLSSPAAPSFEWMNQEWSLTKWNASNSAH